jgi:2TM domain
MMAKYKGIDMTYNSEEMKQIFQIALARKDDEEFSWEQMIDIASELGISAESLKAVEKQWLVQQVDSQKRKAFNIQRRKDFKSHLVSFIVVNGFLVLLNLVTSPSFLWSVFPLLGWGLGLFLHWKGVSQTQGESYEKDFQEWCKNMRQNKNSL